VNNVLLNKILHKKESPVLKKEKQKKKKAVLKRQLLG
jgi:hypothetical protein